MKYKRKQMVINESIQHEKELNDWIDTLKHGTFSHDTKLYWLKRFEEFKKE